MKGIFFSLSSFMAISSGSDSPLSSTMTGAFMLQVRMHRVARQQLLPQTCG